ncbi:hypothetical protein TSOC_008512, partial [Tetrabaena socialis]
STDVKGNALPDKDEAQCAPEEGLSGGVSQSDGDGGVEEIVAGACRAAGEDVVISIGGCCGVTTRAAVNLSNFRYDEEALRMGREGLPHDVVRFGAPRPANEDARMATVRALRGMQVDRCPELNLILKVVCRIWDAPAACITLLDSDHVFICCGE